MLIPQDVAQRIQDIVIAEQFYHLVVIVTQHVPEEYAHLLMYVRRRKSRKLYNKAEGSAGDQLDSTAAICCQIAKSKQRCSYC